MSNQKKYPKDLWKCSTNSINLAKRNINKCSICHNDLLNNNIVITKCNHKFHFSCLNKWKKKNNSCPLCRKALENDNITKLNNVIQNLSIQNENNYNNPYDEYYNTGVSINSIPIRNTLDYNNPNIDDIDDYQIGMNSFVDLNTIRNQY
jgi:hypothetical protein